MPNIFSRLATLAQQLGPVRVPSSWPLRNPVLGPYERLGDCQRALAGSAETSDPLVRALLRIGRDDDLAHTVLVLGLAPALKRKAPGPRSDAYLEDSVGELTLTVLEAHDVDEATGLAGRLVNRAHNRTLRRYAQIRRNQARETLLPDTLSTESQTSDELESVVIDRLQVEEFGRAARRTIDQGRLTEATWQTYVDLRLTRALLGDVAPVGNALRNRGLRAAVMVHDRVVKALVPAHTP